MLKKLWVYSKRYGWGKTLSSAAVTLFSIFSAFIHFLSLRYQCSKAPLTHDPLISSPQKHSPFYVLFVTPVYPMVSTHYRVQTIRECLTNLNISSEVIPWTLFTSSQKILRQAKILILFRCPLTSKEREWLRRQTHVQKNIIVTSLDDLLFSKKLIAEHARFPSSFGERERTIYFQEAERYAELISQTDALLVSTENLAHAASDFKKPTFVIDNGIDSLQMDWAREAVNSIEPPLHRTLGYFSGTLTHESDFHAISEVIGKLLRTYSTLRLTLAGYVHLPPNLSPFSERIHQLPAVGWKRLSALMRNNAHIALAPLESANPLVRAKSAVKYTQAALVKIPMVASPIPSFEAAIRSGKNGYIARTPDEWFEYLSLLIENETLCREMGERAFEQALSDFGKEAVTSQTAKVFQQLVSL